jgi:hypothetical protein
LTAELAAIKAKQRSTKANTSGTSGGGMLVPRHGSASEAFSAAVYEKRRDGLGCESCDSFLENYELLFIVFNLHVCIHQCPCMCRFMEYPMRSFKVDAAADGSAKKVRVPFNLCAF